MDIYTSGFRKEDIIKLLNDIKKTIKRVEQNVPIQIDNAINQLLDGAPQALDTLKELADALGNNPDFLTELNNRIDNINTEVPVETQIPNDGCKPNVFYKLGQIGNTSFSFAAITDDTIMNQYMIEFSTGNNAPTITWPNDIIGWSTGVAPTIAANKTYQISVLSGLAVIVEF